MPENPLPEVAGFQVFARGRIWVFANSIAEADFPMVQIREDRPLATKYVGQVLLSRWKSHLNVTFNPNC